MAASFKTPVLSRSKNPALETSVGFILSPPLAESTKIAATNATPCNSSIVTSNSSENRKSSSAKPKRVRRNYDRFKIGHLVDKKDGVLDANGRLITVKDRIDALFKPVNDSPKVQISPSTSSDETSEVSELPPDPRYPTLLKSTITTRDIYDCQRLCTRLNFIKEDMDKMMKETSPRIEQRIKDISERKKEIYEMYQQKLDRIDRDLLKHKFHSSTDVSGEAKSTNTPAGATAASLKGFTPVGAGAASHKKGITPKNSRNSLDDFVTVAKKRVVEQPEPIQQPKQEKPEPVAAASKRRKTMFGSFVTSSKAESQKPRGVIVTTSLHQNEQSFVAEAVAKLDGFTLQEDVSRTTTHLVCGAPRRTMNVLRAVSRGCWVMSIEWISASLNAGRWLSEEEYEAVTYFPQCRVPRLKRQGSQTEDGTTATTRRRVKAAANNNNQDKAEESSSLGLSSALPILAGSGAIFVSPDLSKPKEHDVVQLIRLCAGQVAKSAEEAQIVIATSYPKNISLAPQTIVVSPNWLLDSIMTVSLQPTSNFLLNADRRS